MRAPQFAPDTPNDRQMTPQEIAENNRPRSPFRTARDYAAAKDAGSSYRAILANDTKLKLGGASLEEKRAKRFQYATTWHERLQEMQQRRIQGREFAERLFNGKKEKDYIINGLDEASSQAKAAFAALIRVQQSSLDDDVKTKLENEYRSKVENANAYFDDMLAVSQGQMQFDLAIKRNQVRQMGPEVEMIEGENRGSPSFEYSPEFKSVPRELPQAPGSSTGAAPPAAPAKPKKAPHPAKKPAPPGPAPAPAGPTVGPQGAAPAAPAAPKKKTAEDLSRLFGKKSKKKPVAKTTE